eukprot:Gb_02253 [translate_table: standard]
MDEESQKRNTDCVYFLASPLTCKKGSECEYRHSESARINPRDCWYWLGGNCMNLHCAFRHPPLEGRPTASSTESLPASGNANKCRVPCYYFFQGYCAKGDKCSFMHGPFYGGNPGASASQKPTKVSSTGTEPQSAEKKATIGNDSVTVDIAPVRSTSAEVQIPTEAKHVNQAGSQPRHLKTDHHTPEPSLPEVEFPQLRMPDAPISTVNLGGRSRVSQVQPTNDEWLQDDIETEWLEESSPGFDVLVDDGPEQLCYQEDTDYLSNYDMEPGTESTHGQERILHVTDELLEFDYDHPSVHDQSGYIEGVRKYDHRSYDPYEELNHDHLSYDHISRRKRKNFTGRAPEVAVVSGRRSLSVEGYSRHSENGDLRHRLAKRRRADRAHTADNSSRRQHLDTLPGDFHRSRRQRDDEQRHRDAVARRQQGVRQNNMRLHGRTPSGNGSFSRESFIDVESNFEGNPERLRLRHSPTRHGSGEHFRSRYKEKERGRILMDAATLSESSGFRTKTQKTELRKDTDFARPKTLEQIKEEKRRAGLLENGFKVCDSFEEPKNSVQSESHWMRGVVLKSQVQPLHNLPGDERKISLGKVVVHESSKLPSFEGPKPLSAILKAKQKSVNNESVEISGAEGTQGISQRLELNGNTQNSGIGGKANVLPLGSEKEVEEKELALGDQYTFEVTTDIQKERPSCVATGFQEGNASLQENGTPLTRENNKVEIMKMNEVIKSCVEKPDVCFEPRENENGGRTGECKPEPGEDEDYMEDDEEDDFARKLGGFFS